MIKVGAATEVELKERKHRIEDAIAATRAAIEEGIIAGGGAALRARRRAALDGDLGLTGDEATGVAVVRERAGRAAALDRRQRRPRGLRRRRRRCASCDANHGLNAATGEYDDLLAAGVVDPVKVTKAALANAASVAGTILLDAERDRREAGGAGARPRR